MFVNASTRKTAAREIIVLGLSIFVVAVLGVVGNFCFATIELKRKKIDRAATRKLNFDLEPEYPETSLSWQANKWFRKPLPLDRVGAAPMNNQRRC